jgi:hypothetical protein
MPSHAAVVPARISTGPDGQCVVAQSESREEPASGLQADAAPPASPSPSGAGAQSAPRAASVFPGPDVALPPDFCNAIGKLETALGLPIWIMLQGRGGQYASLDEDVVCAFRQARADLPRNTRAGLLIDSLGGEARAAYQIAMVLRKHCGAFVAIVPRRAKSAATLLSLGADEIALGTDGELGPLDAQVYDPDREDVLSALDEFQALERLHAFALEAIDRSMNLFLSRTHKKIDTLMPLVIRFVTEMVRPLFEKIDAVHYTQVARALKVAEDYATRLLMAQYPTREAEQVARVLVEKYSEHGFVIDATEAKAIGLNLLALSADQIEAVDALVPFLEQNQTVLGCLKERTAS